jgi:hypothetical protein
MRRRATAIGDLLPVAAGVALLGGSVWMLLDGDARRATAPSPAQTAANIRPVGRVHVAEAPPPSAAAAESDVATAEPTRATRASAPAESTPKASAAPSAAAPVAPPAQPAAVGTHAPAVGQVARAPAPSADATTEPAAQPPAAAAAAPAKPQPEQETTPRPSAAGAEPVSTAPPGAVAPKALELMPGAHGWHGTYAHAPDGIVLFPHRIGPMQGAAAAVVGGPGVFRITPEGKVYFELLHRARDATITAPPPGGR